MQPLHLQLYVTNCHLQLTMVTFVTISQVTNFIGSLLQLCYNYWFIHPFNGMIFTNTFILESLLWAITLP
jgi:hypothetical protein